MKLFKHFLAFAMAMVLMAGSMPVSLEANNQASALPFINQSTEMRGLWVTSAYNLDWPSRTGLTPDENRAEINDILNRAAQQGINAVFVQVRPVADALHQSEIFPWSHLLTGTQGNDPGFDPLAYWITRAHAMGIEVHAWLNPYRVTFPNQHITNPQNLHPTHPARLNPDTVIAYGSSLFFDPGNPAARQIVLDGVEELLLNYNLDGIHLDDYFYPSRNFPDNASFARYGQGQDRHDWRRENVNTLVRDLQRITHQTRPGASFGISPFAIWRNDDADPRGSATRGMESYFSQYADTRRWVLEGWVDYIAPQIYWVEGNPAACFEVVLTWWEDLVRGTDVRLYIGLAPYREVLRTSDTRFSNWRAGEMVRQLTRIANSDVANGSIFFRERFMRNEVGDSIGQFYASNLPGLVPTRRQQAAPPITITPTPTPPTGLPPIAIPPPTQPTSPEALPPITIPPLGDRPVEPPTGDAILVPPPRPSVPRIPIPTPPMPAPANPAASGLTITQPRGATASVTDAAGFWFYGAALPDVNVYVNGQLVEDRTSEGFFSIFMPITRGENVFTFTQAGQAPVTRTITNNAPAQAGPPLTLLRPMIQAAFPLTDEWGRPGDTIPLRATAPSGARVTATIAGQTVELSQVNPNLTMATAANIISAQFAGEFTLSTDAAADAIIDIGRPIYLMEWDGHSYSATAEGHIRQLGVDAPFFAQISGATAWAFPGATTTGGSSWKLTQGQIDRIAQITGGWTRLQSGLWVESDNIATFRDVDFVDSAAGFSVGEYVVGDYFDTIAWAVPFNPVVDARFADGLLTVSLGIVGDLPSITGVGQVGALFSNVELVGQQYVMTLAEGQHLEGFFTTYADGVLTLHLRRRRPLATGALPFDGFTFVVDAGHGGTDSGAIGPLGAAYSEAALVLQQADRLTAQLEALGATVVRIRDTDTFYTLQQRVEISRQAKPDMFISLHINATAETTDATTIRGFTAWYRNPTSANAANRFITNMHHVNPGSNRHRAPNQANFYVCRPSWSPSVLLEASFINNIHDFQWLINPQRQEEYVRAIVNTLLSYYR